MNHIYKIPTVLFLLFFHFGYSGNEFYNKGTLVMLNSGDASAIPTLFVNGDFINKDGDFRNTTSFLEVKGNITNNPTTNHYSSTGIERLSGSIDQAIFGTWNGTSADRDQFYNLKIYKTSTSGENIILDDAVTGNSVNVNAAGSFAFEGANGIIRTQNSSVGTTDATSTGDYTNKLYLQNPAPAKFTGYNTGSGATTKFIEGKLQLQANSGNVYYFPVGVKPSLLGGMNAFQLNLTSLSASTAILGFVKPYTTALVASDYTFCDVAQIDNNPITANYFSTCIGPPDGIMDLMKLTNHTSHSWDITPQVVPATVNYDLTVYPSSNLNSTATFTAIPCGPYPFVKYLARNGVPGGNLATLGNSPAFNNVLGYYSCITGNTLSAQDGFSNFQLWGADNTNTNLPVELTKFFITPINNLYFNLNWQTASELNNAGFFIERSINGASFEQIGWIAGNGTTNAIHEYSFADHNVIPGIKYYYKLKQVDINQTFKYSNTLLGILTSSTDFNVLTIMPNPTNINPQVIIYLPGDGNLQANIYDILGQVLKTTSFSLNKGINYVHLDMDDLAKANYLVKFDYNNSTITKKVTKN